MGFHVNGVYLSLVFVVLDLKLLLSLPYSFQWSESNVESTTTQIYRYFNNLSSGKCSSYNLEGDEDKGKKVLKWKSELKHELVYMYLDVYSHMNLYICT